MEETRLEIIELRYLTEAVLRKAQCRAAHCDVIDALANIVSEFKELDDLATEIIGD